MYMCFTVSSGQGLLPQLVCREYRNINTFDPSTTLLYGALRVAVGIERYKSRIYHSVLVY
jgi:hypothetical protein